MSAVMQGCHQKKPMRFTTAYYVILLYLTVIFRPLVPLVNDALSHIFIDSKHIATVHAVSGDNHLEKEMADGETTNKHSSGKIAAPDFPHINCATIKYEILAGKFSKDYFSFPPKINPAIFLSIQAPPPKFI